MNEKGEKKKHLFYEDQSRQSGPEVVILLFNLLFLLKSVLSVNRDALN